VRVLKGAGIEDKNFERSWHFVLRVHNTFYGNRFEPNNYPLLVSVCTECRQFWLR